MSDLPSLSGVGLITGAAGGIGRETAISFAEAGCAAVVFADINFDAAKSAAEESKDYAPNKAYRALPLRVDVSDPQSVKEMVDKTVSEFGRIDYNINAAGLGPATMTPAANLDLNELHSMIETNLKGVIYCIRAVAAQMLTQERIFQPSPSQRHRNKPPRDLGRGAIVNIGSVYSASPDYGMLPYITAKHGVLGATRAAAVDHGRDGIRVCAVLPGPVDTQIMRDAIRDIPPMGEAIGKNVLLGGRMADPEEVAGVVRFLCSPIASFITGSGTVVDGGATLALTK